MLLAVLAVGGAACGSSSTPTASPVTVFSVSADPGLGLPAAGASHPAVLTSPQLHASLDSLLSQHADLVATLMHLVASGDDNPVAAIKALGANTQSLTDAIAVVYGIDAGRAFAQLWEQHTQFFIDYAQATRDHDGRGKDEAESRLRDYQNDFASFVTTATSGGVPLVAVTNLLHGHVEDLTRYIEADVAGNRAEAARILVQAVTHIRVIANAVAGAIIAQHLTTVSR